MSHRPSDLCVTRVGPLTAACARALPIEVAG